nr:hypothetical protein CFP56_41150 [Quercus suber]
MHQSSDKQQSSAAQSALHHQEHALVPSNQCPISKAQCEQLLTFLKSGAGGGDRHHAASVSTSCLVTGGEGISSAASEMVGTSTQNNLNFNSALMSDPFISEVDSTSEGCLGPFVTPYSVPDMHNDQSASCSDITPSPSSIPISTHHVPLPDSLPSDSTSVLLDSIPFSSGQAAIKCSTEYTTSSGQCAIMYNTRTDAIQCNTTYIASSGRD